MMINNVNGELVARRSEMRSCSMVLSGITPEYVQYLCTVSLEEIYRALAVLKRLNKTATSSGPSGAASAAAPWKSMRGCWRKGE